jgi:hypothetical protein
MEAQHVKAETLNTNVKQSNFIPELYSIRLCQRGRGYLFLEKRFGFDARRKALGHMFGGP